MSSRRKLAFSTSPARRWLNVSLGMPRQWGRRVEQRQFAGVRCATSLSDPHKDNPRSTFEQGGRAIKVGMLTRRRCTSARRLRSGRARCVRAYSGPRCMHGRGRLIDAVGSIRSARARASSMHGPANRRAGSRQKAADRSTSHAVRGSCSIRSACKATPACSIFPGGGYWLES